eukprot:15420053-Heterocapsa_arctica.AAC.1
MCSANCPSWTATLIAMNSLSARRQGHNRLSTAPGADQRPAEERAATRGRPSTRAARPICIGVDVQVRGAVFDVVAGELQDVVLSAFEVAQQALHPQPIAA